MSSTARTAATAVAWVAAGAIGATVLTGVASAGSFAPAAAPSGSSAVTATADTAAGQARRGMLRDVLHGSLTLKTDTGTKVVDIQRGEITAASASSVTVRSTDGFTATYAIGEGTVVRRDRATVGGGDLVVGDTAMVRSTAGTADVVRALSPDALTKLQERLANGRPGGRGMGGMGGGMGGMGLGADSDDA
ncbi:MAG: hypothetical protein AB7O74_09820 [Candidatus Nanopelagicales bacterium]